MPEVHDIPGWPAPPAIRPVPESTAATYWVSAGARVRPAWGRWWIVTRGMWMPVAFLEPLAAGPSGFPSRRAVAFQASVARPSEATGTKPYSIFTDLPEYGPRSMTRYRRRDTRRALREFRYSVLREPGLLLAQGWPVVTEAALHSGSWTPADRPAYERYIDSLFRAATPPLIVTAVQNGRLAGYLTSYAVGDTAYLNDLYIAPWARTRNAGAGLYWLTLAAWRTVPGVTRASAGRLFDGHVHEHKSSLGAGVVLVPVLAKIRRPVAAVLRRVRPDGAFLRLAGITPATPD